VAEPLPIEPFLRIRSASAPAFVDGGARLAFVGDMTGVPQVYVMDAAGGWPDQLTFASDRVAALVASADGEHLAFARDAGGDERHALHLTRPERNLTPRPGIRYPGAFSPDGRLLGFTHTERNDTDFDVAVVDVVTGERRELAQPGGYAIVEDAGPRGLLVVVYDGPFDHRLLVVDLETGAAVDAAPHEGGEQYVMPRFGADGEIVCGCDRGSEFVRLAEIDVGGSLRFLSDDDADVEAVAVRGSSRAVVRNEGGASRLTIDGVAVPLPDGVVTTLAFDPSGSRLALDLAPPDGACDVWVVDASGPRQVTRAPLGGLPEGVLRRPSQHEFTSFDGLQVPYMLYGARDVPTLVLVHGGPESQARPRPDGLVQFLAARGIAVAVPNVRGSTGYGRTYTHLDDVEKRLDSVADLAGLASELAGVPLGVMGGSYGGYMTLAAITEYPDLWRCAVDIVGIANFVTFLERTGSYRRALREAEYGSLERDRAFLESISPIRKVDHIVAPLLVIHGANDPRVPLHEAEQIAAALRERERDVELLVYDDEGHGLVKLANRLDAYPRIAAFLARHLG
jgi:dipeptidyl aminopeptidase/acylaminoacyl peptidase